MSFRIGSFVAAAMSEAQASRDVPKTAIRPISAARPRQCDPEAAPFHDCDFARRHGRARPALAIVAEPREN